MIRRSGGGLCSKKRIAARLLAAPVLVLSCGVGRAAVTEYWDSDGSVSGNSSTTGANLGGSGVWSTGAANWWDPSQATLQNWTNDNFAVFWGSGGTVSNAGVSAGALSFKSNGYNIVGGTLSMTSPSPAVFMTDAGVTATIGSAIAGTATMAKQGAGTLVLTNPSSTNTVTSSDGGWRVEGGTLRLDSDGNLGISPGPGVTDLQINQSTIQAGGSFRLEPTRRTKINTNGLDPTATIDTNGFAVEWDGSIQGGNAALVVTNSTGAGILILGTDKRNQINPFGQTLPGGTVNLTVQHGAILQTSGTTTPTGGELGSETGAAGAVLAFKLDDGQIRAESGGYTFSRNLILGAGGGSFDAGSWGHTLLGTITGTSTLKKFGIGSLVIDNPDPNPSGTNSAWTGGINIVSGTVQIGRGGTNGFLPGQNPLQDTGPSSVPVVINGGATLVLQHSNSHINHVLISGAGNLTVGGSRTETLMGENTYTGLTTINSGATLRIGFGDGRGSIVSDVANSGTLTFRRSGTITYSGVVSGTGTLDQEGPGTVVLGGNNNYTGATVINNSKLMVEGALAKTAVSVNSAASLGGRGAIGGTVVLAGGASAGTRGAIDLTDGVVGTLTLSDATVSDIALSVGGAAAGNPSLLAYDVGASSDRIFISSAKISVDMGGGIISVNPLSGFGAGVYHLIDFGAGQGSGLDRLTLASSTVGGYSLSLQTTTTSELLVVSVPEPGALSMIVVGLVCMGGRRGRRSQSR